MMGSIPRLQTKAFGAKKAGKKLRTRMSAFISKLLIEKGLLYSFIGLLLGRAIILSVVSPFAVAFLATIWVVHRKHSVKVMIAVFAGAATHSGKHAVFTLLGMIVFLFLANLFRKVKRDQIAIPIFAFAATTLPRLFLYTMSDKLAVYEWMLLLVEGVLSAVLVLIFMQSLPLLSPNKYKPVLKNEEIVCMIILLASVLTGTIGWEFQGAQVEHVLSRYFVLLLSFVGGAAIGSTVGVVAGLILSLANAANLYQMSLLAFSGLLGGLLKEGSKFGVSAGLLVGTCLISIYGDASSWGPSLAASALAAVLFFLTPASWSNRLSRYIPGTEAYTNEQEQYLQKVRNVTARRVEQFSDVFEALSKSFSAKSELVLEEEDERKETDYFLSQVTEKTCQSCFMKDRCWQQNFDETYAMMGNLKEMLMYGHELKGKPLRDFEDRCVKTNRVIEVMHQEASHFAASRKLKRQVIESKRLVADQLLGVSEVMDDFAKEILKEREQHEMQEMQIVQALQGMGIELEKLEIYQLEKSNIDIEMTVTFQYYRGEASKLIAPILSDILNEMIIVKEEEISPFPNGHCYLAFGSAKEFMIETGIASAAKDGGLVSGDSFTTMELGTGKYAMAISDGMGNGRRANEESKETLRLLQQILQTGIPEKAAIKSINSILALRSTDEMFATLDLAVINLHNASVQFLKIGSTPSLIKRGREVLSIEASNLPMGIIQDFDIEIVSEQLQPDDLLIMMSDGIFEGPKRIPNIDLWLKQKMGEMLTTDPQEVADLLMEEVIRTNDGEISDDMTVLVARIVKNKPEWASIPVRFNPEMQMQ